MRSIKHISIIGAGNVATHLGHALHKKGLIIDSVYSRKLKRSQVLSLKLNAQATNKISHIAKDSHLYIIAVSDDAIATVSKNLSKHIPVNSWVAHTSGSTSMATIKFDNRGVFYPLQSFSIDRPIDFKSVPFCINSSSSEMQNKLVALAKKISKSVQLISDKERSVLHLAAIFSANFSNHMYHLANMICEENEVDFDILKPLILETASKINIGTPKAMQTGPARRDDQTTMKNHLMQLSQHTTEKKIYKLISASIKKTYH